MYSRSRIVEVGSIPASWSMASTRCFFDSVQRGSKIGASGYTSTIVVSGQRSCQHGRCDIRPIDVSCWSRRTRLQVKPQSRWTQPVNTSSPRILRAKQPSLKGRLSPDRSTRLREASLRTEMCSRARSWSIECYQKGQAGRPWTHHPDPCGRDYIIFMTTTSSRLSFSSPCNMYVFPLSFDALHRCGGAVLSSTTTGCIFSVLLKLKSVISEMMVSSVRSTSTASIS
nr:hypothetical protein CFP56_10070 [Quercus suber]